MNNSPNQLANLDKGIPNRFKAGDKQGRAEAGRKGGIKSGQSKTISAYLKAWSEGKVDDKMRERLKARGIDEPDSNGAIIAGKLVEMCARGDIRAIQMVMEKIGEDAKREAEIERLKAEIELLKLQKQKIELGETSTVEDLTSLASLLRLHDEENSSND